MKLAIATASVIKGDGQGRANYEIVHHALAQGFDVYMLSDQVSTELVELGAKWIPIQPRPAKPNLIKGWLAAHQTTRALSQLDKQFDIIHGYGFSLTSPHHVNTSQFVHSAWLKSPSHPSHHCRNVAGVYYWLYTALNARWEKRAYMSADTVVGASQQVCKELQTIGVSAQNMRVILNGVDLQEFRPGKVDRAALGLPENRMLALFAGDIRTSRKNLETVLKALKSVPGLHLVVAGSVEKSPYPAMAEDLGIAQRTHFLGFRRDIAEIMRGCDMFVFPSRYEACSLALLEAIASGLPVITSIKTGGSEALTPDCSILLDDTENVEALGSAMHQLLDSPTRRGYMAQAARNTAEKYGWGKIAQSYIELYFEISR